MGFNEGTEIMSKPIPSPYDDILLEMSLDEMKREAASSREAYNKHRALGNVGMHPIKADNARQFMIDRQARVFMFEQGLSYADCRFCNSGVIITGFLDSTLDDLFKIAA
jgi:hypothetical protein